MIHTEQNNSDKVGESLSGDSIAKDSKIENSIGVLVGKNINLRDFNVTIFNQSNAYGLKILPSNYFEEYKSTTANYENWKKGFAFNLESIKVEKEYKRKRVLSEIKEILERERRVLLLGEMGTSKTTVPRFLLQYCSDGTYLIDTEDGSKAFLNPQSCRAGDVVLSSC